MTIRYFKLKENDNIIFTDLSKRNIQYNIHYKEGVDYKGDKYTDFRKNKVVDFYNPRDFYEKRGKKIIHIKLTDVKYAGGQEIESTENILAEYNMNNFIEIQGEKALSILKENELTFSELYDKNTL